MIESGKHTTAVDLHADAPVIDVRPVAAPRREEAWREIRHGIAVLIPAAIIVLLIMVGVGYTITRPLNALGLTRWEGGVDRYFAAHRSGGWNAVTKFASLAGDTPTIITIAAISFLALRLMTHRWRESILVAVAMLGEVTIFFFTTLLIERPRPTVPHLDGSPPTSGFPSGHTAASTTLYGLLAVIAVVYASRALLRALPVIAALLIVAAIGTSRLYRGMHYPSDVLGGVLLGVLWLTVVATVILRPHLPHSDEAGLHRRPTTA